MFHYVEIRYCFNLYLNWFSVVELRMCSGIEFQNEAPEYLIGNVRVLSCYLKS